MNSFTTILFTRVSLITHRLIVSVRLPVRLLENCFLILRNIIPLTLSYKHRILRIYNKL